MATGEISWVGKKRRRLDHGIGRQGRRSASRAEGCLGAAPDSREDRVPARPASSDRRGGRPLEVEAAVRAKGIPPGSPLAGEEWLSGPYALLYGINEIERTMQALARGRIRKPGARCGPNATGRAARGAGLSGRSLRPAAPRRRSGRGVDAKGGHRRQPALPRGGVLPAKLPRREGGAGARGREHRLHLPAWIFSTSSTPKARSAS